MIEILSLLVLVWIYLGVIGSCTLVYEDYLKKGSRKFFALVLSLNFIEVYLLLRFQLEALSRSLEIICVAFVVFIIILVMLYVYNKRISKCSKIEFRTVDGRNSMFVMVGLLALGIILRKEST